MAGLGSAVLLGLALNAIALVLRAAESAVEQGSIT